MDDMRNTSAPLYGKAEPATTKTTMSVREMRQLLGPVSYTHLDVYKRQILYKSVSDPNYEKILEMARRIGVSWSAIRIRLQQMQVINCLLYTSRCV